MRIRVTRVSEIRDCLKLSLASLSAGVAVLSLYAWLADLRCGSGVTRVSEIRDCLKLSLASLSAGVAVLSLYAWLADLRVRIGLRVFRDFKTPENFRE